MSEQSGLFRRTGTKSGAAARRAARGRRHTHSPTDRVAICRNWPANLIIDAHLGLLEHHKQPSASSTMLFRARWLSINLQQDNKLDILKISELFSHMPDFPIPSNKSASLLVSPRMPLVRIAADLVTLSAETSREHAVPTATRYCLQIVQAPEPGCPLSGRLGLHLIDAIA